MIALAHKVLIRVKETMVIKVTQAPTGNATQQARVIRCNFEKVSHSKGSNGGKTINDRTAPGRIRTVGSKKVQEAIDEGTPAFKYILPMVWATVAVNNCPQQIMPAKHPGVIQFKLIRWTIHIPTVAAIEFAELHQAVIQIIFGRGKSEMQANRLSHSCEQDPVIRVSTFTIHLCQPCNDLCLLSLCHFVEDALTTHPNRYGNIGAFHNALIHVANITPVSVWVVCVRAIQQCLPEQRFHIYFVFLKFNYRRVGGVAQPRAPGRSDARKRFDGIC